MSAFHSGQLATSAHCCQIASGLTVVSMLCSVSHMLGPAYIARVLRIQMAACTVRLRSKLLRLEGASPIAAPSSPRIAMRQTSLGRSNAPQDR